MKHDGKHEWSGNTGMVVCSRCGMKVNTSVFDIATITEGCPLPPDPPEVDRAGVPAITLNYFNPMGYDSLRENYLRAEYEMRWWGVPLFVCEVLYPGQLALVADRPGVTVYRFSADDSHLLWQKERLINFVAERMPPEFDTLAWIDADVSMLNRHWVADMLAALRRFDVVQLWTRWHFLGPRGDIIQTGNTVGRWAQRFLIDQNAGSNSSHPGGAWAARREVFPLYAPHALGGGDQFTLEGWTDKRETFLQRQLNTAWVQSFFRWADEAYAKVQGRVTCIPGEMVHHYHGTRANRQYATRTEVLGALGFDPDAHLRVDPQGLYQWTEAATPELRDACRRYFTGRKEDDGHTF